jgi:hypothetical protein
MNHGGPVWPDNVHETGVSAGGRSGSLIVAAEAEKVERTRRKTSSRARSEVSVPPDARRVSVKRRLPVRRGLSVPSGLARLQDRQPSAPSGAARAVEHQLPELSLEVGLHLQELEPQHLRVNRNRMGAVQAGVECFVEDRARGRRLLLTARTARSRISRSCAPRPKPKPRQPGQPCVRPSERTRCNDSRTIDRPGSRDRCE